MSKNRKFVRVFQNFYQQFSRKSPSTVKEQSLWLLRSFIVTKKRPEWINAGFVLPTVAMVSLVVVLLTIAILFRSFERSKNASNVRVNQAVLNAATPALDRARAKIDKLFNDPRLPRSTPNDFSLKQVISDNVSEFTFGDETQLTLSYNVDKLKTAWKYPVDTDNNGKYDSYTLYGIYFTNPPTSGGNPTRARSPLDARTPPMNEVRGGDKCDRGDKTSASLIGSQGWYENNGVLKRSLFVYTTTVPITDDKGLGTEYETFKGNKGFAALEYQQDRERRPLTSNAVLYNDDLEISPGGGIKLNGRIFTNSNLLAGKSKSKGDIEFYLVSSPDSCYYSATNSKIIVGGNVANARLKDTSDLDEVKVHLFKESGVGGTKQIDTNNKSINLAGGNQVAYNSEAYERRINLLVEAAKRKADTALPSEVTDELKKITDADASLDKNTVKEQLLKTYFRKRTRRVPYAEVPLNDMSKALGSYTKFNVLGTTSGESMRPPDKWVFPFNPANGTVHGGYANLPLKADGDKIKLPAQATDYPEPEGEEKFLGDRILVGNNMPQMWWDDSKKKFVSQEEAGQEINGKKWNEGDGKRKRYPQVRQLDDLGATGRNEFWEKSAAEYPTDKLDVVGGLRVITGAGIYLPNDYNPSSRSFSKTQKTVWADNMPMGVTSEAQGLPNDKTPYLQMRATVVYHFQNDTYKPGTNNPQTPIACVSSLYDPTNEDTAKNVEKYKNKTLSWNSSSTGNSNNGIVYAVPSYSKKSTYLTVLNYQASLKYSNGRLVNEQLKKALAKGSSGKLTLSEKSALDSAICALQIMDGTLSPVTGSSPVIPHGAISEKAFLDARQIKAIDKPGDEKNYELDVELRQPLEIRTTVLDMNLLRTTKAGTTKYSTQEYLIPNSGIIYATRDDALPDLSDETVDISGTDFKLDPTRRPNGIMLINGEDLSRVNEWRPEEKGLILVSDLPVYIKGDFNKHTQEEFLENLNSTWSNFYTRRNAFPEDKRLNKNFACRKDQFDGCGSGETWRPATVIADAITVLSKDFKEGVRSEGDYDLRDNWGYAALGYDYNGNGTIGTNLVTLNEKVLQLDLNGDGDTNDSNISRLSEKILGIDLTRDGDKKDISVAITEKNIPGIVATRLNGIWDNNFASSFPWKDNGNNAPSTLSGAAINSSYFNNFVTPIQRRNKFSEYIMEICPKRVVAACTPDDWVVGYDLDEDGDFDDTVTLVVKKNPDGTKVTVTYVEKEIKANQLAQALNDAFINKRLEKNSTYKFSTKKIMAGTTTLTAEDITLPRRVAFLRHGNGLTVKEDSKDLTKDTSGKIFKDNSLVLDTNNKPVPLGTGKIKLTFDGGKTTGYDYFTVKYYPYSSTLKINDIDYEKFSLSPSNIPTTQNNTLWFKTDNSGSPNYGHGYPLLIKNKDALSANQPTDQPLLIPLLQIQVPFERSSKADISVTDPKYLNSQSDLRRKPKTWLQKAVSTETNLIFAQGDTPGRPTESNGGLENFVRYLEDWNGQNHQALGSFIQFRRSSYATAPWQAFTANYNNGTSSNPERGYTSSNTGTIFGYTQGYMITVNNDSGKNFGRTPFYIQPNRLWGFDVGLLTQLPDLFSQRFTAPPNGEPSEFYREVSRDDKWVSTLLCAKDGSSQYIISQNQRPSQCK
ncbi:MAG: hormogonium polysaccharide biosynthesis protein HpsA [Cyanobacteria bacterium P01_H01_bin.150]